METLTYEELRRIEQLERNSPELVKISNEFYGIVRDHIALLEKKLKKEQTTNSGSRKESLLTNEIKNTRRLSESIYERREKKIMQLALATVRGGEPHLKYLTGGENRFYDMLLDTLKEGRQMILGGSTQKKKSDVTIIRILKELPQFIGRDMKKYSLREEDVLSVPKDMAKILIERGAAEEIK